LNNRTLVRYIIYVLQFYNVYFTTHIGLNRPFSGRLRKLDEY